MAYLEQEVLSYFFVRIAQCKKPRKITTKELHTRTKFQWFLSKVPHSSFKQLVVSMPSLLRGLHTMSFAKSVPEGLKPQECKHTKLPEPPPVPYVPDKDEVQEEVAKLRNLKIKTSLAKDTTLNFLVWHKNGTQEVFLMHVTAVLDAIKKRGMFNNYDKAQKAYEDAKKAVDLVEAGLALLNGTSSGSRKDCKKKALAKAKEALAKTPETKSETKEAEEATKVTKDTMKAGFQANLEKAKKAMEDTKGAMTTVASHMFVFYLNLLSPESKYSWNMIVSKQTERDPFINLQGVSLEGPREMSHKLFNNCVMFHLLTAFPINAAEQEKCYITNVLKKPQHVKHQFVRCVEQINAYITQMHTSTTAPMQMPAPSPRTCHSWRLS
jgi:hypothetical protein